MTWICTGKVRALCGLSAAKSRPMWYFQKRYVMLRIWHSQVISCTKFSSQSIAFILIPLLDFLIFQFGTAMLKQSFSIFSFVWHYLQLLESTMKRGLLSVLSLRRRVSPFGFAWPVWQDRCVLWRLSVALSLGCFWFQCPMSINRLQLQH